MDPVLSEYTAAVEILKSQLQAYQVQLKELKIQVLELVKQNRNLTNELKESIHHRMSDEKIIEELKLQVKFATQLKHSGAKIQQAELSASSHDDGINIARVREAEGRIAEIRRHYDRGIKILSDELSERQNQLSSVRASLEGKVKELEECQHNLCEIEKDKQSLETEKNALVNENKEVKNELFNIKNQLFDQQKRLNEIEKDNSLQKTRNDELSAMCKQLRENVSSLHDQKLSLEKKMKKAVLDAQSAILQKKALSYKEHLAETFIKDLKQSVSQEVNHAVSVHKLAVKNVEKEYEVKLLALEDQVKTLQLEICERQSLFEKAVREKKSLEVLFKTSSKAEQTLVSGVTFEEICQKLFASEKAREEALLKIESLENSLRDVQKSHLEEREFFLTETQQLKEKLKKMETDLAEALENKLHLAEQAENANKKYKSMLKHSQFTESQLKKKISILKETSQKELELLRIKIQTNEEQYRKSVAYLHHLLDSQQKINRELENSFKDLTVKFELKMKEMLQTSVP